MKRWIKRGAAASEKTAAPGFSFIPSSVAPVRGNRWMDLLLRLLVIELGMFGSAWTFFSAMDIWPQGSAMAVWLGLYAAVAVLIYSSDNWPFLLLIPTAPLAIWAYVTFDTLSTGFISLLNRTLRTMTENSPWRFVQFALDSMPLSELRWAETHFMVLLFCSLALGAGFFVVRRPFLPGFLLFTAPLALFPLFFTLMPQLWAFFALVAAWVMMAMLQQPLGLRKKEKKKSEIVARQKNARQQIALLLGVCVMVSAALSAAVIPQDNYQRPEGFQEWLNSMGNWAQRLFHVEEDLHNLPELRFTGATALEVDCNIQQPLYLRGYAAGEFTGGSWEVIPDSDYEEAASAFSGMERNPQNLYASYWSDVQDSYTVTVRNVAPNRNSLFLPGGLVTDISRMDGAWYRQDLYAETRSFWGVGEYTVQALALPDLCQISLGFEEPSIAQWFQPAGGETGIKAMMENYEVFLYENYTALPEDTRQSAQEWWRQYLGQEGEVPLREACSILQEIFNSEFLYRYDPPSFPEGREYLQWFLEDAKEGYCVHYATAGVLLLRALGIPARYAEGYIVTQDDYANGEWTRDGFLKISDDHAHAWVEVYDPVGMSWIPVELTPGFSSESFWESPNGNEQPESTPVPSEKPEVTPTPTPEAEVTPTPTPQEQPTPEPGSTPTPAPQGPQGGSGGSFQLPDWLWPVLAAVLCVILAVGAVCLRRKRLLERQRRSTRQTNVSLAVREYWKWAFRMLSLAGAPVWENTDTPESYTARLCEKFPELDREAMLVACEIGQLAEFSGKELEESQRRTMEEWARSLCRFLMGKMGFWSRMRGKWLLGLF